MGGGGKADALSSLVESGGLQALGYPVDEEEGMGTYSNPNGTFILYSSCALGPESEPVIPSGKDPILYVSGMNIQVSFEGGPEGMNPEVIVCIGIAGTRVDDIGTDVQYISSGGFVE